MQNVKRDLIVVGLGMLVLAMMTPVLAAKPFKLDPDSAKQAELEKKVLAEGSKRSLIPALVAYRKTAENVEYPSGKLTLPGVLYRPAGKGPFPAVIWNHGSEKTP